MVQPIKPPPFAGVDFRNEQITVDFSHFERPAAGFACDWAHLERTPLGIEIVFGQTYPFPERHIRSAFVVVMEESKFKLAFVNGLEHLRKTLDENNIRPAQMTVEVENAPDKVHRIIADAAIMDVVLPQAEIAFYRVSPFGVRRLSDKSFKLKQGDLVKPEAVVMLDTRLLASIVQDAAELELGDAT